MGFVENITRWWNTHHTARKFVKTMVLATLGFIVAQQAALLAVLPVWAVVPATALIAAIANWLQYNSASFAGKFKGTAVRAKKVVSK